MTQDLIGKTRNSSCSKISSGRKDRFNGFRHFLLAREILTSGKESFETFDFLPFSQEIGCHPDFSKDLNLPPKTDTDEQIRLAPTSHRPSPSPSVPLPHTAVEHLWAAQPGDQGARSLRSQRLDQVRTTYVRRTTYDVESGGTGTFGTDLGGGGERLLSGWGVSPTWWVGRGDVVLGCIGMGRMQLSGTAVRCRCTVAVVQELLRHVGLLCE